MKFSKIVAIAFAALSIIGCDKSDDPVIDHAQNITGTYYGNLELSVNGKTMGSVENISLQVDRIDAENVTFVLDAFDFSSYSIPQIEAGAAVKSGSGIYVTEGDIHTESESFTTTGDFNGETDGQSISVVFNFQFGAMPMPVVGTFKGSKSQATMTVDARDYNSWTYINLATGATQTVRDFSAWNYLSSGSVTSTTPAVGSESDITIDWHIAIHRYDIKTNGGAALATEETNMGNVTSFTSSGYIEDENVENGIITDMTDMMKGIIGYASTAKVNPVLSKWLTATPTGTMPPYTYEPTNLIYVVKCTDGNYIKLKFTDNTNETGTSGYVTFTYEYVRVN